MTALELLKSRDSLQNLIPFMKDESALRVISAWPIIGRDFVLYKEAELPLRKDVSATPAIEALWMWAHDRFKMEEVAKQAEVPFTICERIFYRLTRAGIIYPDGTISIHASNLLTSTAISHIRTLRGRFYEPTRPNASGPSVPNAADKTVPAELTPTPRADKAGRVDAGNARPKTRRANRKNVKA
jgi:hypothetical protein